MKKPFKYILWGMLPTAALTVFAFFFLTGSFFITRAVLPLCSRQWGVDVGASQVNWSIWSSHVEFRDLTVGPLSDPYFKATSGKFDYNLAALLKGNLKFSHILVNQGVYIIHMERPDDPAADATADNDPVLIDLSDGKAVDSNVVITFGSGQSPSAIEFTRLNFEFDRFANDQRLTGSARSDIRYASSRNSHVDSGQLDFKISTKLNEKLLPETMKLHAALSRLKGEISERKLDNANLKVIIDATDNHDLLEIKELTVVEADKRDITLSKANLKGAVNWEPFGFRSEFHIERLSETTVAVLCDLLGNFNPGYGNLSASGEVEYFKRKLRANGQVNVERSGSAVFGQKKYDIVPFSVSAQYDFLIDLGKRMTDLKKFDLCINDKTKEIASVHLDTPVKYSWSQAAEVNPDKTPACFRLNFRDFDLNILRFLTPSESEFLLNSGRLNAEMLFSIDHDFAQAKLTGEAKIDNSELKLLNTRVPLNSTCAFAVAVNKKMDYKLTKFDLTLNSHQKLLGKLQLSGTGNLKNETGALSVGAVELQTEIIKLFMPGDQEKTLKTIDRMHFNNIGCTVNFLYDLEHPKLDVKTVSAEFKYLGNSTVKIEVMPFVYLPLEKTVDKDWQIKITGKLPAANLNTLIERPDFKFNAGNFGLNVRTSVARDFSSSLIKGDFNLDNLDFTVKGKDYRNLSLQGLTAIYLPNYDSVEISTFNLYLKNDNRSATRVEIPGKIDLKNQTFSFNADIRYLNENFANIFTDTDVMSLNISGPVGVSGNLTEHSYKVNCSLNFDNCVLPNLSGNNLSGSLIANYESVNNLDSLRRFLLKVKDQKGDVMDLSLRKAYNPTLNQTEYQLRSSFVDFDKLKGLFADGGKVKAEAKEKIEKRLDFGTGKTFVDCSVGKIHWGKDFNTSFRGNFLLDDNSIALSDGKLRGDGGEFDVQLNAQNVTEGIRYRFRVLTAAGPMNLMPFYGLLTEGEQTNLTGKIDRIDGEIFLTDDGGNDWVTRSVSGYLAADFSKLSVPNSVAFGPFGNILLLPVYSISKFYRLFDTGITDVKNLSQMTQNEKTVLKNINSIYFDRGGFKINFHKGAGQIESCRFGGDPVRDLTFAGIFELDGEQNINMESNMNISGISLTLPITGTLYSPKISFVNSARETLMKIPEVYIMDMENTAAGKIFPIKKAKEMLQKLK